MSENTNCPCTDICPLMKAVTAIGGKWKIPIICSLTVDGPTRYNDLKRRMKGISDTMLARSLKELEEADLVTRKVYSETPIRVEYEVTSKGKDLLPIISSLAQWASEL